MLAKGYVRGGGGYYLSEKLDGMRAYWNDGKLVSRNMKPIHAPDWWLNCLPPFPLDGELYMGRGMFQDTISIVRRTVNILENAWIDIKYHVFDSPPWSSFEISGGFGAIYKTLKHELEGNEVVVVVNQEKLPHRADDIIIKKLDQIVSIGGEGLILRHPTAVWEPGKSDYMLKVKPFRTGEGVVTGYTEGKGRNYGVLGALIIDGRFKLSGFTDTERELAKQLFPIGSIISYHFVGLTKAGVPKEARYLRI